MEIENRCSSCGSPPHLKHLRNCKTHGNADFKSGTAQAATRGQLDMVTDLIQQLGYKEDEYHLDVISSVACSKLIAQLLIERG